MGFIIFMSSAVWGLNIKNMTNNDELNKIQDQIDFLQKCTKDKKYPESARRKFKEMIDDLVEKEMELMK